MKLLETIASAFSPMYSAPTTPVIPVDSLDPHEYYAFAGQQYLSPWQYSYLDGNKFPGGFGPTQIQIVDYWSLRAQSVQLFNENHYARGLLRRLITNEVNTGLTPEARPDEEVLGLPENSQANWTTDVENRFGLWGKSPQACDWKRNSTFGAIQRAARLEALISGDVLVVLRQSPRTQSPQVQLISGNRVQTPLSASEAPRKGNIIRHGVELDPQGRTVAFWVRQPDNLTTKRLPAYGEKSGRKLAWLVFGTEKRLEDVRGMPILSLVLQSLKEIDRYRDSVQRKAVINSIFAMFIKKEENMPGTRPVSNAAVRKEEAGTTDINGNTRTFNLQQYVPGVIMEELQTGETPHGFDNTGTDESFGTFEEAIVQSIAWAQEIPPEILKLAFSNNYSASQAAINEFRIYLNKFWSEFGEAFCTPIYNEWLINEALLGKNSAPGLLEAWRNPQAYDTFAAWVAVDWYGSIKPATDMVKQARGSQLLVANGWSTNARESRVLTGTKFDQNIKRLRRENEQIAEVNAPLIEAGQPIENDLSTNSAVAQTAEAILELVADER